MCRFWRGVLGASAGVWSAGAGCGVRGARCGVRGAGRSERAALALQSCSGEPQHQPSVSQPNEAPSASHCRALTQRSPQLPLSLALSLCVCEREKEGEGEREVKSDGRQVKNENTPVK